MFVNGGFEKFVCVWGGIIVIYLLFVKGIVIGDEMVFFWFGGFDLFVLVVLNVVKFWDL